MKKILSAFMCFVMLCTLAVSFAEEDRISATESELEAIGILQAFGVVDESFDAEAVMSREDFTVMLVRALGGADAMLDKLPYLDVPESAESFPYVAKAYEMGLISPAEQFNPKDPVLPEHAYKMLVIALGYYAPAAQKGGYMAGYASIAATLSLSKGVSFGDDGLTGANAARLIFNTLNTPVMKQTTYGAEERYERDKDSLLMNIRLDIYEERGVVTANALADIDGLNMSKGSVKIDGVRYLEGSSGAGLLFGRNVKFYYRQAADDDIGTVLYAKADDSRNEVYTVDARDIQSGTSVSSFVYIDNETGKTEALALSAEVDVVYNGSCLFGYGREHLMPEVGSVTLIDNNSDGAIDIVLVRNYMVAVVSAGNADAEIVHFKFGAASLDLSQYRTYQITKNGVECSIGDLKEWDVLSIAAYEDVAEIVVTSRALSGTLQEISEKDGVIESITVDGETAELSKGFITRSAELMAGDSGTFYLGADGRVVAANLKTTQQPNYAIYLAAQNEKGISGEVSLQFFNKRGEIEILKAAERVSVNGKGCAREDLAQSLEALGAQYSLVVIDANLDGELTSVQTADDRAMEDGYEGYDPGAFTLDKKLDSARFYLYWGGGVTLSDSVAIFSVPTDKTRTDLYLCEGKSKLSGDITIKNVKIYDIDRFGKVSAMVIEDFDAEMPADTPHVNLYEHWYLVSSIKSAADENGNVRKKITGYYKNDYREFYLADNGAVNVGQMMKPDGARMGNAAPNQLTKWGFVGETEKDLRPGDVIQTGLNAKGELAYFRKLYSAELDGVDIRFSADGAFGGDDLVYYEPGDFYEINENSPAQNAQDPGYMSSCYTAYGQITDVDGANYRFKTTYAQEDGAGGIIRHSISRVQKNSGAVYLFSRGKEAVSKVSTAELRVGDRIFVHVQDTQNRYVLIVRD